MKTRLGILWIGVLVLGLTAPAQATLIDRGGGLIYDSDQDLTWLQDANYAKTSGHDADGAMTWDAAMAWAGGLSYGGFTDWRLPTVTDIGNDGCNGSYSGTDCGYNVNTSGQELAYLWYDILDNIAYCDTSGNCPQSGSGVTNTGPFTNLQSRSIDYFWAFYWSGTEYATNPDWAWRFGTGEGGQDRNLKDNKFYAWAVRSGDVVPEPGTVLLLVTGLAGMLGFGRMRRR